MRKKVWIGFGILAFAASLIFAPKLTFQRLAHPEFLWGLLLLIPMVWGLRYQQGQQQERLQRLYDSQLHPRLFREPLMPVWQKQLPLLILFGCIIMALARPQGPLVMSDGSQSGIDILIGIDVSDSMKATDEGYPNRMGGATRIVQQLTPFIDGDRVGLFVFSGEAFSLAPFTYDHSTLQSFVEEVGPTLLPSATTDLEEALKHALTRFGIKTDDTQSQISDPTNAEKAGQMLLLFSDGENQLGDYRDELKVLTEHNIPVITIGVGTAEGARIPEESIMGRSYKVWQGDYAISKLDEKALMAISEATQGSYLPLKNIKGLPEILKTTRDQLHMRSSEQKTQQFEERYAYWLALGVLGWLLWPILLKQWKQWFKQRQPRQSFAPFSVILKRTLKTKPARGLPMAFIALLLSPLLQSAVSWNPLGWRPFWKNSQGEQAYEAQQYDEAAKAFAQGLKNDPNNPALKNNEGHAQYQNKDYDKAIENYQGNLESPQLSPEQKANTLYNLGNSYYRKGQGTPAEQEKSWQAALDAYQKALQLNPQDEQAMENLNFVQQQLQKQQQQQQSKGQNDKNNPQQQQPPSGDKPEAQPSPNDSQQPENPPQNPGEAPQNVPTPEPSPQYFDEAEVDQFLKQQEQEERQSKGNFHRSRKKQSDSSQNKNGDPWNQRVKNW